MLDRNGEGALGAALELEDVAAIAGQPGQLPISELDARAGLVEKAESWRYNGAVVPGYPNLHPLEPDFWPTFWKIFARFSRQPGLSLFIQGPVPALGKQP